MEIRLARKNVTQEEPYFTSHSDNAACDVENTRREKKRQEKKNKDKEREKIHYTHRDLPRDVA